MKYFSLLFILLSLIGCYEHQSPESSQQITISTKDILDQYRIRYANDSAYTDFINGLKSVQKMIILDCNEEKKIYTCPIDFRRYFSSFDKLSIDPQWSLESHYRHFGDAGRPILLAFEKGSDVSDSIKEELRENAEPSIRPNLKDSDAKPTKEPWKSISDYELSTRLFKYQDSISYLKPIHIKDDKMGYFQFAVFALLGDNYCLFWHSNYSHLDILTSKSQLLQLTQLNGDFYYRFSNEEKQQILCIDPEPAIDMSEQYTDVTLLWLSPWDGFFRRKYRISRTWPHTFDIMSDDTIMTYQCGITF
jgi:hypothetical protein